MKKDKPLRFKVFSSTGIVIWFKTKEGAQQYILDKYKNAEIGVHYNLIEYGNPEKEAKTGKTGDSRVKN